jgi:AraC family ethanolamine operon transcriptional activator
MTMIHYKSTTSDDVNDHAASLSQWDQQYDQVSAGRFTGRLEELWLGPVQVFRESTARAVLQRGAPCPQSLTLATPVGDGPNEAWFCGRRVGAQQAFGLVAHSEFELATRGAFDIVAISVHRDHLDAHARRVDGVGLAGVPARNEVLDTPVPANDRLRALLLATLAAARDTPQLLAQPAARQAMTDALCDALMARFGPRAQADGPGADITAAITATTRQRVVREARRYMQAHADAPISVPDLCEALHVSRRTLQYSFQDVLQMSPVSYLRALRLNGVRRDLQRGGDEAVADHAARWGFWHPSRFAADYLQLFGERPSETLRQARGATGLH